MKKREQGTRYGSSLFDLSGRIDHGRDDNAMNFCTDCDQITPENAERCDRCSVKTVYMLAGMNNLMMH